ERHAEDPIRVPAKRRDLSPLDEVPDFDLAGLSYLPPGGGQPAAVAAEGYVIDDARVSAESPGMWIDILTEGSAVPDSDPPILAGGSQATPMRVEEHPAHNVLVSTKRQQLLTCFRVPDANGLVGTGGDQAPAVRSKRHADDAFRVSSAGWATPAG